MKFYSPSIRLATESFWEYIVFAMNSMIFLLMGFAINLKMLWELFPFILIAYISVLFARFFVIGSTWLVFEPTNYKFPFSWAVIMWWGGLRGALSMVLALSIPDSFALKELIVTMVFGVVLISIFVQGLTMAPLMKKLGIISPISQIKTYEFLKTEISLYQDMIDKLNDMYKHHLLNQETLKALTDEYQEKINLLSQELEQVEIDKDALVKEEVLKTKRKMIMEEMKAILDKYHSGMISIEVYISIKHELDSQLFELENMGA
ncbi:cation:proton antiporter domain-containing protein [Sulfurimonas sp.]